MTKIRPHKTITTLITFHFRPDLKPDAFEPVPEDFEALPGRSEPFEIADGEEFLDRVEPAALEPTFELAREPTAEPKPEPVVEPILEPPPIFEPGFDPVLEPSTFDLILDFSLEPALSDAVGELAGGELAGELEPVEEPTS